jgi:hypothetical protein
VADRPLRWAWWAAELLQIVPALSVQVDGFFQAGVQQLDAALEGVKARAWLPQRLRLVT